jgi:signal transduction histidine kinase
MACLKWRIKMPSILIIDDEEGVRITLKKIMEREGYQVDTAADFVDAIQLLDKNFYHTVITDILLPGMSGLDLLRAIKERDQELPVIVITGEPNLETAKESIRYGAYDYIEKPVTKDNLPPIVNRSVDKKVLIEEKQRLEKENLEYQRDLEKKVKERTKKIETLNLLLKEFQSKLIHSERLATLGTFVSFVSHELRNPLSVIQNSIYYLRTHIQTDNPKIEKYFGIMDDEVAIAHKIIDDFLNFTKGRSLELSSVNINVLIKKVIDLISIPDNIRINLNLEKDFPDIKVDGDYIQQVLINMINNATQAMPKGGELRLSSRKEEEFIIIEISDTGVGIAEKDLERLFEPFFSKKQKGTGLGLVICKFLIERHKGKITVESKPGKGTNFSIHLPIDIDTLRKKSRFFIP